MYKIILVHLTKNYNFMKKSKLTIEQIRKSKVSIISNLKKIKGGTIIIEDLGQI